MKLMMTNVTTYYYPLRKILSYPIKLDGYLISYGKYRRYDLSTHLRMVHSMDPLTDKILISLYININHMAHDLP